MALKKILIDSDICLDSITARHPFPVYADKLLEAVEDRVVADVVSAESLTEIPSTSKRHPFLFIRRGNF